MNARGRILLVASLVVLGVGVTLVGGAAKSAAEDTVNGCSTGKPICASITADHNPASRSPAGTDHYVSYDLEVFYNPESGATSNLVNFAVQVTWADVGVTTTTSTYVAGSEQDCALTAPQTLTCTGTPKSLGPGGSFGYQGLIFRTASTTADPLVPSGTNVSVTASTKETPKPPKGGTNVAFVTTTYPTSYENVGDEDTSTAGGGLTTTLATTNAGTVNQISKLPVPGGVARGVFKVSEDNYGGTVSCPANYTCFGQHVTTQAVGLAPVNLQIVYDGVLPSGATENSIGVFHVRADTTVFITTDCPSATPTLQEITDLNGCRLVDVSPGASGPAKHVEISAWDISNGSWGGAG
jgi:hypothetical protein